MIGWVDAGDNYEYTFMLICLPGEFSAEKHKDIHYIANLLEMLDKLSILRLEDGYNGDYYDVYISKRVKHDQVG